MANIDLRNCNAKMCKTCIFQPQQKVVTPGRLTEIQLYLIKGTNHICHTTNKICRGARNFQLQVFFRMGLISSETDEALYEQAAKYKERVVERKT